MLKILKMLRRSFFGIEQYKSTKYVPIMPDEVKKSREIMIVSTGTVMKWCIITCPCGCGEIHKIPLMRTAEPRWDCDIHKDKTISLSPSIDVNSSGCGAHFFIKKNKVIWAKE